MSITYPIQISNFEFRISDLRRDEAFRSLLISDFGFRISDFRRGQVFRSIGICCPRLGLTTAHNRTLREQCTHDVDAITSRYASRDNPSAGGRFQVLRTIPRAGKSEIRNPKSEILWKAHSTS